MVRFFIDRPIFSAVISILIALSGLIFLNQLPIAQYPEITPPSISVSCQYPGADAQVVAQTVATAIEQQVLGVENMLYMSSQSTNDGGYNLNVTFAVGTDLDMAQVLVQNRVNLALPTLPAEVKQTGVSVKKRSPSILLVVNLISPQQTYDQLYLSNFASLVMRDELVKLDGVGDVAQLGQMDYSMRVWLDPDRMAARGLTAVDVVQSLREQNVQVAAGSLGRAPTMAGNAFQYSLSTLGRLKNPEQFAEIVIRADAEGRSVYLRDIVSEQREIEGRCLGGIQVGAKRQDTVCLLDGQPSVGLGIYQQPGSNAIATAERVKEKVAELRERFPPDLDYAIVYDTTPFIEESVHEVFKALRDAIVLVALVVLLFLQSWRATLIPLIAIPVALLGTFAVMAGLGMSLNNLSLFGLVLAIGIVVDDAIVVVEAIEHKIENGLNPREAAHQAMAEVAGPIIAISLVLMSVFIPCLFIAGITGQFFYQFAITIATATFFSAINSLTLSPALAAILLQPKHEQRDPLSWLIKRTLGWLFAGFNLAFEKVAGWYAGTVRGLLRISLLVLLVYAGLLWTTYRTMQSVPTGFIPTQDKGYLLVDFRLPESASLERTRAAVERAVAMLQAPSGQLAANPIGPARGTGGLEEAQAAQLAQATAGVAHTVSVIGQSFVQNAVGSNYGSMFLVLDDFEHRQDPGLGAEAVASRLRKLLYLAVPEAQVSVFGAPAVDGLGSAGGFKVMIRDVGDLGYNELEAAGREVATSGSQTPGIAGVISSFNAAAPQMFVDIDREKCKKMGIALNDVFLSLQLFLGGYYANDFNQFDRTWQVNLQADPAFRLTPEDVGKLKVRNNRGEIVPLAAFARVRESVGPALITRYDGRPAAALNGASLPGVSSGEVIETMEKIWKEKLPQGMDARWTELTLLQIQAGNTALIVFGIAVVLVFLVLAAQYESWGLPLAVILVVPMCLLASTIGIILARMDLNIFVQIGFVVLVGLASKNAILIVEFAKEEVARGTKLAEATVNACRLRLRPIIMTSLAFIFGVIPLAVASGAGAEMRATLGIAVFSGMLGVTIFGIFLTPVFFYVVSWFRPDPKPNGMLTAAENPHSAD
jgi:multidrug efflux pump subunit AcrB